MSTTSTAHPVTPEELMALRDGELSAGRAHFVSTHTESCTACQQASASFQHTARSLTSWTVGEAPSSVADRVLAVAGKAEHREPRSIFGRRRRLLLIAGASAFAVVVLMMLSISHPAVREQHQIAAPGYARFKQADSLAGDSNAKPAAMEVAPDSGRAVAGLTAHVNSSLDGNVSQDEMSRLQVYAKLQRAAEPALPGPMIARTVSLAILVKDFDRSRSSLDSILLRYHGYSANLTVNTPQGAARSLNASLRIPAPQLPAALAELKTLGHVENENQTGEEVTQQHADLVARLKNSRETEQRLQAILTERTGKISDVLSVEQEIARVRGEIEQMEAEQKNLEHRVDFAGIDLNLGEEYKAKLDSTAPSLSTRLHNALVNGYRNVADTLVSMLLFFAEYGPILLFWCLVLLVPAWFLWRRWRQAAHAI